MNKFCDKKHQQSRHMHSSVSCGPRKQDCAWKRWLYLFTPRAMYDFTPYRSSVISCTNKTIFAGQVPAYQERPHTRLNFEEYPVSHYHASLQKLFFSYFLLFCTIANTAIKRKHVIRVLSNLALITTKKRAYDGTKF